MGKFLNSNILTFILLLTALVLLFMIYGCKGKEKAVGVITPTKKAYPEKRKIIKQSTSTFIFKASEYEDVLSGFKVRSDSSATNISYSRQYVDLRRGDAMVLVKIVAYQNATMVYRLFHPSKTKIKRGSMATIDPLYEDLNDFGEFHGSGGTTEFVRHNLYIMVRSRNLPKGTSLKVAKAIDKKIKASPVLVRNNSDEAEFTTSKEINSRQHQINRRQHQIKELKNLLAISKDKEAALRAELGEEIRLLKKAVSNYEKRLSLPKKGVGHFNIGGRPQGPEAE